MDSFHLMAIAPIDGRYAQHTEELQALFSEYALIRLRLLVEIRWLCALADHPCIQETFVLSRDDRQCLDQLIVQFTLDDAKRIKIIEQKINHDTKAVEYFLREKCGEYTQLLHCSPWIHFGCTSEDINNIAYSMMLHQARTQHILPLMDQLIEFFRDYAHRYAQQAMLARTHGQPATPTTVGKEFAIIVARLRTQRKRFADLLLFAKWNGAVGNYNAQVFAYPEVDWQATAERFVKQFGLQWQAYTTQVESHDSIAQYCDILKHFNAILIKVTEDMWHYIAMDYFKQKPQAQEIGSSTMPHKVNPIYFENAEANLSLANTLCQHFSEHLIRSRWQRDLRDSTLKRNLGLVFAHSLLAYKNILQGFLRVEINTQCIEQDLAQHWEVLTEAIQTVLRRYNLEQAYETVKTLSHGQQLDQKRVHAIIHQLPIPDFVKENLLALTPNTYLGYARDLAKMI